MENERTLMDLVTQSNEIVNQIMQNGGEISEEMITEMDSNALMMAEKVDNYSFAIAKLKSDQELFKKRADQYSKISKAIKTTVENIKSRLIFGMNELGETEIKGLERRFKLSKTKGKLIINEKELPEAYKLKTIVIEPNKDKIKADLEMGVKIKGVTLEAGVSLREYASK